jgi:hypothetical protein
MFSIVGISFLCMVISGAIGLEWVQFSGVAFSFAALASIVFFSAIDAWECETETSSSEPERVLVSATINASKRR